MSEVAEERMVDAGPEPTLEDTYNPPSDTDAKPVEAEVEAETPPAEAPAEPTEDAEDGKTEPPAPPSGADKSVPLAGLLDERDKRKTAEAEAEALRKQLAEATESTERTSVFDDEEAAFNERITPIVDAFETARMRDRFELSREMMMMAKDDFEARESEFLALAADRPELVTQLQESQNPARFAYETAVKHEELQAMENIDEWREKERAKLKEELLAEMQGEQSDADKRAAKKREIASSPSLAGERSKGGAEERITDDEPLDAVLGG